MRTEEETRALVRERYGAIARGEESCCAPASCGCGDEMAPDGLNVIGDAYAGVAGRLAEADLNLGCGVPTRHAALRPGETVLDLGSGAGNDAFIARHEVGPEGRVLGVDMTAEMIAKARANAAKLGYDNVEFRDGRDRAAAGRCRQRRRRDHQLRAEPGARQGAARSPRCSACCGRADGSASPTSSRPASCPPRCARWQRSMSAASPAPWPRSDYLALLETTGFDDVRVAEAKPIAAARRGARRHMSAAEIAAFRASGVTLKSVTVLGTKPAS